jgi:probable HAF family extracellular repeat protein
VTLTVGGVTVPVLYAGPQGQYAGLDQVNAGPLPHSFEGRGEINAALTVDGKLANAVTVSFSGRGTFTSIDPPGSTSTIAYGVNTSGQVVGYYTNASGTHGFLMSAGTFSTIDFPGASVTSASGINGAGQIVGTYVANGLHGFLSTRGHSYHTGFPWNPKRDTKRHQQFRADRRIL